MTATRVDCAGTSSRMASLLKDQRGISLVELALSMPILIYLILGLVELSNYALQRQKLSQLALQIADNAGRIGEIGMTSPQRITEKQINDVLVGGLVHVGDPRLIRSGRVILSSLELNEDSGQWIHWQRCGGELRHEPSWGRQDTGRRGTSFAGMGPAESRIVAEQGRPVMFVEVALRMQAIAIPALIPSTPIVETAAMPIRVDRDTSSVANTERVGAATCR